MEADEDIYYATPQIAGNTAPNAQVEKYGNAIHRDSDLFAF